MSEKEVKPISTKVESIIKGLFLVLIAIVIAINVGKVSRTLAFLPLYLFGSCYYLLLLPVLFFGFYRIFRLKKFHFKRKSIVAFLFFLFASILFVVGFASFKVNGRTYETELGTLLNNYNAQLAGYYEAKYINVFESGSYWTNGIIGTLICGLIANDTIVIFIGAVLFVIAIFCFASHYIVLSMKKPKGEKVKLPKVKKEKKVKKIVKEIENIEEEEIPNEPIGKEIEPLEVKPGYEIDNRPIINENSGFDPIYLDNEFYNNDSHSVSDVFDHSDFVPLSFPKGPSNDFMNAEPAPASFFERKEEVSEPETSLFGEEYPEEEVDENNLIETRPEEIVEERVERPINDDLVKMQPQFIEPPMMKDEEVIIPEAPKKKERVVWIPPSSDLLMTYETEQARELNESVALERLELINKTLNDFRIGARCSGFTIGPSITRFNIEYDANVSVKSVERLDKDISLRLGGVTSRFAAIVPGEAYSGLEIPNATITTVSFKDVFNALPDVKKHPLSVAFGKNISGEVVAADFDEFPHLLVAGTTGSGKSIYIHSIICTLIMRMSPDDLKIVLVDPKKVEMKKYADMPHLLCPIITEADKAKVLLQKLVDEMNRRYDLFAQNGSVSNIKQYNEIAEEYGVDPLPFIIVVLDEYADLVDTCKEISQPVVSIAQKARAAGIHLLISTQRPSTNVITGVIKGNLPTHVALMTSSYTDSITIIGEGGAETLLGKGDMLVQSPLVSRVGVTRLQGCFVQNKEIIHIVNYLKEHYETAYDENYLDLVDHSNDPVVNALAPGEVIKESSEEEENKYQSIKEWVMSQEYISMSKIQRECSVGFNRAGRFFSRLQKEGIVAMTQDSSSKGCKVLVHDDFYDDGDNLPTSDEVIY